MREPLQGILQRFAMREAEGAQHELQALLESLARVLETPACFIRAAGAHAPARPLAVWPARHRSEIHALLEGCDAMDARSEAGLLASRVAAPVALNGVPADRITHVLATPLRTADREVFGELGIFASEPSLAPHRKAVLKAFAAQVVAEVERARAEGALGRQRAYFRQLLETSQDGIAILDRNDRILELNSCFERIFHVREGDVVGRKINDVIVPEDMFDEARSLSETSFRGEVIHVETRRRRAEGELFPVQILAYPVILENEQVGVYAAYRDLSEREHAEARLRASEEKYRSLFETSKDVIYISNPEGKLLDINSAGVELLEYPSKEELLAIDVGKELYVRPKDRERLIERISTEGVARDFETVLRTRNGNEVVVQDTCVAVRDEHGRLVEYRGFLRDITNQRVLEEQLRQSQKLEAVGRIAGGVAHDFNNLLMGIEGYASAIAADLPEESPLINDIEEIRRMGRMGGQLTRKLLAFSRQQVLKLETLDINLILRDLGKFLERVLGEDIELRLELEPTLWPVRADAGQLEQVVMNLAVNARDAMPSGGALSIASSNITVHGAKLAERLGGRQGDYVRLVVSDTGHGMAREIRERIFEPFFTTKEVGKGSGLGLSIVYGIVQQCKGFIDVRSELGRGASFTIYLPRHEGSPQKSAETKAREDLQGRGETILLVEDEVSVRRILRRRLEQKGYSVIDAGDGQSALSLSRARRGALDLVITDVVMPGMRGTELARKLKTERPGLKVIFVTGYADENLQQSLEDSSCAGLLEKPFEPDELLRKMRDVLERRDGEGS